MRKQAGDVADLKTCDQRGEFKKRAQQALFLGINAKLWHTELLSPVLRE
jgi:hypothetical protein